MKTKLLLVFLFAAGIVNCFAQAGILDPTFGVNGIVDILVEDQKYEMAQAIAIQSDGKIILGGGKGQYSCLKRYNDNGSLDTSFGTMGMVNAALPGIPVYSTAVIYSIALQPDGSIIAAVSVDTGNYMAIARYSADGILDTSFGTDGVTLVDVYPNSGAPLEIVENVQVLANGKIVLMARMFDVGYNANVAYITRLEANGAIDASFGFGNGIFAAEMGTGWVQAGTVQPDGKVLILTTPYIGNNYVSMIARYSADGTLDTTFGDMGIEVIAGGIGHFYCKDILVQPDGKIVIGGQAEITEGLAAFCYARLTADGNLDSNFGINGISIFNSNLQGITDKIVLQPDGKIVAAGKVYNSVLAVTRCNIDGTVDTSFGINGRADYNTETTNDYITGAALQPDGKIVVCGTFYHATGTPNFMMMRYLNNNIAGLTENKFKNFAIYPNPAQNTLYIQNPENSIIENLLITDVTGKTILQKAGNSSQIDIGTLPQGIYFLKISSASGNTNLKFIKQ